jgi:hypothetical protein
MYNRSTSPQEDMSPPLGHIILTPNKPVVTTYKYDARLAEKQRLPILKPSVWLGRGSTPRPPALEEFWPKKLLFDQFCTYLKLHTRYIKYKNIVFLGLPLFHPCQNILTSGFWCYIIHVYLRKLWLFRFFFLTFVIQVLVISWSVTKSLYCQG